LNNIGGERFLSIIELLGKNKTVADVGCDHGKLSTYLIENDLAEKVFATDISAPSLEKAKKRSADMKINNIEFYLGDGLSVLNAPPECAVIAGMGGETVAHIIRHPNARTKLVLQPMKDQDVLYKALCDLNFYVDKVKIAHEGRRFYEVISAHYGEKDDFDCFLPPLDRLVYDDNAVLYLQRRIAITQKAAEGAKISDRSRYALLVDEVERLKASLEGLKHKRCDDVSK